MLLLFSTGVPLLYTGVLALLCNEVNQLYVYMHPLLLGLPSHPFAYILVITEHQAELSVLYSSFPRTIYFTHHSVYVANLISQGISPSPSPMPTHLLSMSTFLF